MSLFIVILGFTLAISSKWAYSYFGLSSFEQIVYHIKVPLEGTNTQFIFGWMKKCLLPNVIKLRNGIFEGNTKNVLLFFL